jgi:putative spermidine/putrescine transport system permease protein
MSQYAVLERPAPSLTGFTMPLTALLGAIFGVLAGLANGMPLAGLAGGAVVGAALAWVLTQLMPERRMGRLVAIVVFAVAGVLSGGAGGLASGALVRLLAGQSGDYRMPACRSTRPAGRCLWHNAFLFLCGVIFFFLIAPILTVIPLSFNAEDFFTFTPEMLRFDPEGYSLKHYRTSSPIPTGSRRCATRSRSRPSPRRSVGDARHAGGDRPVAKHVPFRRRSWRS